MWFSFSCIVSASWVFCICWSGCCCHVHEVFSKMICHLWVSVIFANDGITPENVLSNKLLSSERWYTFLKMILYIHSTHSFISESRHWWSVLHKAVMIYTIRSTHVVIPLDPCHIQFLVHPVAQNPDRPFVLIRNGSDYNAARRWLMKVIANHVLEI